MAQIAERVEVEGRLLIGLLLLLVFCLAAAAAHSIKWVLDEMTDFLADAMSVLPFGLGRKLARAVVGLARPLSQVLGRAAAASDAQVGKWYHGLAAVAVEVFDALEAVGMLLVSISYWAASKAATVVLGKQIHYTYTTVATARKQLAQARRDVRIAKQAIAHPGVGAIGHAIRVASGRVAARVARLEHTVGIALPHEIGALRRRTRTVEDTLARMWSRVKGVERATTGLLAAALVATALGRLGGGWIRCRNWQRLGREVCRTPSGWLDGMIALLVAEEAIRDLPGLVRELQAVTRETVEGIQRIAQV